MNSGTAIESVPKDTALGSAFRENAAKIYRFIYAKVGNREAAEDLTSQVFLKATRWLAQDRSADSMRAWLYTVARSTIADYWREQSQQPTVPLEDSDAVLFCGREGPEEVRRTRDRAWRILDTLPEREREVLRLRFLHGYTAPEIGQALGVTPGNVRILQMRALRRAAMHLDLQARVPGEASAKETAPMDDWQWPVE
jgi:RNA polymerase sigma-70 factor (ECF subfamily)